ncbi:hypothetical protein DSECCO2_523700 [anaerobic digester metagenome]
MRHNLQSLEGRRVTFAATFGQYGSWRQHGTAGRTILLMDVRLPDGRIAAQHIWINDLAGFDALGDLVPGDRVRFSATVRSYVKGYLGERIDDRLRRPLRVDYALIHPRQVVRQHRAPSAGVFC